MKTYNLTVNTADNLYADYIVEAKSIEEAEEKARKAFFRDYPDADENIKISFKYVSKDIIKEIMEKLKEE